MVFAAHVLGKRRQASKETAFTVGGRSITADDVERYWRRKQQDPDTIPDVHTPPGLTYRTPSPIQDGTVPRGTRRDPSTMISFQMSLMSCYKM